MIVWLQWYHYQFLLIKWIIGINKFLNLKKHFFGWAKCKEANFCFFCFLNFSNNPCALKKLSGRLNLVFFLSWILQYQIFENVGCCCDLERTIIIIWGNAWSNKKHYFYLRLYNGCGNSLGWDFPQLFI